MEEKEKLFELYKKTQDAQDFFAEKGWESIKFHSLLASSLVSITVGGLVAMHTSSAFNGLNYGAKGLFTSVLMILPIIMFSVIRVGKENFMRECTRMYEQSSISMKLEEAFGFWEDRNKKYRDGFSNDMKYFPKRYNEYFTKWNNAEEFIKDVMSREDTPYRIMKKIFKIFEVSSLILILIIGTVTVLHIVPIFSGVAII